MIRRSTDSLHIPSFWCLRTVGWPLLALVIALDTSFADRQPSTATDNAGASQEALGQREVAVSATPDLVWGVDGRGVAYTLETNPRWPMIWFRMELKERR